MPPASWVEPAELPRDVRYLGQPAGRAREDEPLGGIDVDRRKRHLVEGKENPGRGPSQSLVAIDQRVVHANGMQESGRLLPEFRIGLLPEGDGGRAGSRRGKQSMIADARGTAKDDAGDLDQILNVEVDGHL